jgi:putative ABC transport system permease protein
MKFTDILRLALRNLRESRLRAGLTTMGVVVGVAVIITMISFGLGLQRNAVQRFKDLDLFNEITVSGRSLDSIVSAALAGGKPPAGEGGRQGNDDGGRRGSDDGGRRGGDDGQRGNRRQTDATRTLDDAAVAEIAQVQGVASVEPSVSLYVYVRANGRVQTNSVGGALVPNQASRFKNFSAGKMIESADADEAVVDESFLKSFGFDKPADAIGQTIELLAPRGARDVSANGSNAQTSESDQKGSEQSNSKRVDESARASGGVKNKKSDADEGGMSFFGLPLGGEDDGGGATGGNVAAIAGSFAG